MQRTPFKPQAKRTSRSATAAMRRYLKSEAYRKVAASGGGARERQRRAKTIEERFICLDCKVNTCESGEYYMVHDVVWEKAARKDAGMLCIGCLEQRLERKLTCADFALYPINDGVFFRQSERLRARLAEHRRTEPLIGKSHSQRLIEGTS